MLTYLYYKSIFFRGSKMFRLSKTTRFCHINNPRSKFFYLHCYKSNGDYEIVYLRLSPPSATWCCRPAERLLTKVLRWASSSALHTDSSVSLLKGSRFILRVPENSTGSCPQQTTAFTPLGKVTQLSHFIERLGSNIIMQFLNTFLHCN